MSAPTFDQTKSVLLLAAVAGAAFLAWTAYKAGKTVVTETLNPASEKNAVNTAVNSVVKSVTGDENATLGTKIYDWLNPNESEKLGLSGPAAATTARAPNSFDSFMASLRASTFQGN